jgi:hypothetical protein
MSALRFTAPAGATRTARTYGPLVALAAAFALRMGVITPVKRASQILTTGPQTAPVPGQVASGVEIPGAVVTDQGTAQPGQTSGGPAVAATVHPCDGRPLQVPGDPYSPPCVAFSGNNGGATFKGVTATDIVVALRELEGPTAGEIFAQLSGEPVISSKEAVENTILALADYFNTHFQFYGRKIKVEFFKGQGNGTSELLGGGKEQALSDAVHVSHEMGAFADLSGITLPYSDALVQQGIVNFGSPYPSRDWFIRHAPFAWSNFPDGTNVTESAASEILSRQPAGSIADYAGGDLKGKPRVYGIVAPENVEYQESVSHYESLLAVGNIHPKINLKYKLDVSSMPNQASNIIAQLKDAGVTTVICACDPVMLAHGMAPKANEQDYHPEWVTGGLAFVDQDIVSQLIDPSQWSHAFGMAFNAESEPLGRSFPRSAYRAMRPTSEPAFGVEEFYYQMYILALGIQMAGPNLTPETFEQGMFAYPGGIGPRGSWHFGPEDYTSTDDFREIWWDPDRISAQNGDPGAWVQLTGGARYSDATPPSGPAPFFGE